jgi:hypothetical protein
MRDRNGRIGLAIDTHGVIHVNAGTGRNYAWALCEDKREETTLIVSSINRPAPTCLRCALRVQCAT